MILGITFKENCPDIRNSKVPDIYKEFLDFGMHPFIYDPHADIKEVKKEFGIDLTYKIQKYDAIILAVAHDEFLDMDLMSYKNEKNSIVFDLKAVLDKDKVDSRL